MNPELKRRPLDRIKQLGLRPYEDTPRRPENFHAECTEASEVLVIASTVPLTAVLFQHEAEHLQHTQSTGYRATERALCSEDMLQALCNALGFCATSRGSAFHGPVASLEILHGGDDILSSASFTIWDQVHEGVALQAHERRALRPRVQACTSIGASLRCAASGERERFGVRGGSLRRPSIATSPPRRAGRNFPKETRATGSQDGVGALAKLDVVVTMTETRGEVQAGETEVVEALALKENQTSPTRTDNASREIF
ncbi:hypothetical protein HPB47_001497 [Ixodes persulcatus]|uniref:Uncharacterized protein n=1 Tax=Ixodes persulcatus TaxID=34615 RepID=A0AC60PP73_IXOPE|nr:hypothetical protein HPB47_001497 [Ixodes persulcatus]